MTITFTIIGEPKPKSRPKFFRRGNFVGTYTDKQTRNAEQDFKYQALQYRPPEPLAGELILFINVYRLTPKSFSRKRQALAQENKIRPITRPDCDNYAKLVMDAMNKIFWKDDSQVVSLTINKFYSNQPRIELSLTESNII